MEIGVNTVALADEPLEDVCAYLDTLDVDLLELACGGVHSDNHLPRDRYLDDPAEQRRLWELLESYGMDVSALSTHNNPLHPDDDRQTKTDRELREAITLAGQLDVDTVTCMSGLPAGSPTDDVPNWITAPWPPEQLDALEYQWEVGVEYWNEIADHAATHDVRVAIEMHPNMLVYEPQTLLRVRGATNEYIGANLDPSHLYWQGISIPEAIRVLGEHDAIHHIHAKDTEIRDRHVREKGVLDTTSYAEEADRSWLFRTLGYGHGEDHWREVVSTLRTIGYEGTISVEHEDALLSAKEGLEKSLSFVREVAFETTPDEAHWID